MLSTMGILLLLYLCPYLLVTMSQLLAITDCSWAIPGSHWPSLVVTCFQLLLMATGWLKPQSNLCYDRWSFRQSVLVSCLIWGPRPDFCYCQTVADLFMWGALYDEKTGLSFTIAAGLTSTVKISTTSAICTILHVSILHSQLLNESSSLWTPAVYSFKCNARLYCMYNIYKAWHSRSSPNSCSLCHPR
jgi:hypothetical protein